MNDLSGIAATLRGTDFKGAVGKVDIHSFQGAKTIEEKRLALRESAKQFEAVFIHQMISAMRKTVGESSLMPKSNGQKIFEGMLDEEWSKKLANKTGPGGLGEILYRQLSVRLGLEEADGSAAAQEAQWPVAPFVSPLHNKEQ